AADAGDNEMRGLMARRLERAVRKVKAGDVVDLRVYHNGAYKDVKVTTIKASDLAMDDEGFGFGRAFDGMRIEAPDMPEMPDVHVFKRLPDGLSEQIQLRMRDMQPYLEDMQRSLRKLRTHPVEIYDDGVHRM